MTTPLLDLLSGDKAQATSKDGRMGQKLGIIMRVTDSGHPIGNGLRDAAEHGFVDVMRYFVETLGADPNHRGIFGETAAIVAAQHGQADALRYLIPISDLSLTDDSGKDALMEAASNGQAECCELLAQHPRPKAWTKEGWTALMFAAQRDHAACVPALGSCCRVAMRDVDGRDALSIAAGSDRLGFVQAMLALSPGPTDASIARAIEVATRNSLNPEEPNSCARALRQRALARAERAELSRETSAKRARKAPAPRL